MNIEETIDELWQNYCTITPSARKIKTLFESRGEVIKNDHIALRTFNDPRVNIDKLAQTFEKMGYEPKEVYSFDKKKLKAKHFEHKHESLPKIFISELILEECSISLQRLISNLLDTVSVDAFFDDLIFAGRIWEIPSFETYEELRQESEYAAWMYLNGFVVNHFTVDVNSLQNFSSLEEVNDFLKQNGYRLNSSGGEVKGTPSDYLQQSSILADMVEYEFQEGTYKVPSCYYEFAFRYEMDGRMFRGFIANSADKIFESTDKVLQES